MNTKDNNFSDFKLTVQTGGSLVFEKIGIIPEFLIFNSKTLKRTWRLKLKAKNQNGVLKLNGKIAFFYFFDGFDCKMQAINQDFITNEWEIEEICKVLCD